MAVLAAPSFYLSKSNTDLAHYRNLGSLDFAQE